MIASLNCQYLGLHVSPKEALLLAERHGFGALDMSAQDLMAMNAADAFEFICIQNELGIEAGALGLPIGRLPVAPDEWDSKVDLIDKALDAAEYCHYNRAIIVLLPFHETLQHEAALKENVERLAQLLALLDKRHMKLGIEYVSPPTRRAPYPPENHTITSLAGTLDLITRLEALGHSNCGLLLDSFHWHCANETPQDLQSLRADQVVAVHLCDAPNVPIDEQTVGQRALPGESGVIDLHGFVGALKAIDYIGPVSCEPMASAISRLGTMDPDEIVRLVAESMRKTL